MSPAEAQRAVRQMWHRHGRNPIDGAVIELADAMISASCHQCAAEVIDRAGLDGRAPITVREFRAALREAMGSPRHGLHAGADEPTQRASAEETWWRRVAVGTIVPLVGDRALAELVAALMWAARMPQYASIVTEELIDGTWRHPWQKRAEAFARMRDPDGRISSEVLEQAWSEARRLAREEAGR